MNYFSLDKCDWVASKILRSWLLLMGFSGLLFSQSQGFCQSRAACDASGIQNAYRPLPPLRNHDRGVCANMPIPRGYPELPGSTEGSRGALPARGMFGLNHYYHMTSQSACDPNKASEISRIIRGGPPLSQEALGFLHDKNVSDVFDLRASGEQTIEAGAMTRRLLSSPSRCQDIIDACSLRDFGCSTSAMSHLSSDDKRCVRRRISVSLSRARVGSPAGQSSQESAWAVASGITYHHESLRPQGEGQTWETRMNQIVEEIHRALMQNGGRNVYVHCAAGADRTGTIGAAYQARYGGCTGPDHCQRIACERNRFDFSGRILFSNRCPHE